MRKIAIFITCILLINLVGCTNNVTTGVALLEEKKYEEAKDAFQKDIDKKKRLGEAYHGLGIACFELGEYEEAKDAFKLALKNKEKETSVLYGFLGACYIELGEYEMALDAYDKALSMDDVTEKLTQEIEFNRIAIYESMGDWDAAKKQMEKYEKAYPDDTSIEKESDFLETR